MARNGSPTVTDDVDLDDIAPMTERSAKLAEATDAGRQVDELSADRLTEIGATRMDVAAEDASAPVRVRLEPTQIEHRDVAVLAAQATRAVLAGTREALDTMMRTLASYDDELLGTGAESPEQSPARSVLSALMESVGYALRRIDVARPNVAPGTELARFLHAVDANPGATNTQIGCFTGQQESAVSRTGRQAAAKNLAVVRKYGRQNVWALTERGRNAVAALVATAAEIAAVEAGTVTKPIVHLGAGKSAQLTKAIPTKGPVPPRRPRPQAVAAARAAAAAKVPTKQAKPDGRSIVEGTEQEVVTGVRKAAAGSRKPGHSLVPKPAPAKKSAARKAVPGGAGTKRARSR